MLLLFAMSSLLYTIKSMKIIGHRGAAGLAPENTIASIKAAIAAGVDAIEFDIRATKDGELVVCHDSSTGRTFGTNKKINQITLAEASKIVSSDGHKLPSITDALAAAGNKTVLIEGKGSDWAKPLAKLITRKKSNRFVVISFNHHELFSFSQQCPKVPTFVLEHRNSFDAINAARVYGFDGIDINYWTLNPLTYFLAWRHGLRVAVFTVNRPWIARLISWIYPEVMLTTDFPNKMQFLRARSKSRHVFRAKKS